MTSTTIKVPTELRDRLKARAAASGHTMSEHLEVLLADEARRERFRQLRESMARTPRTPNTRKKHAPGKQTRGADAHGR